MTLGSALTDLATATGAEPGWIGTLVLAAVQGVTEFLPVSSSGHLVLAAELLAVPDAGLFLGVALHVGTLGAVLAVYGGDVVDILRRAVRGDWREPGLLLLGSLPAGLVGILFKDAVEEAFRSPRVAALGLLVTAVLLVAGHRARNKSRSTDASVRAFGALDALVMGLAQALAITPGISRSGSTIAAGLMRGRQARESARFSFLLSIIAVGGAALLQARDVLEGSAPLPNVGWLLVAVLVSGLVGWAALKGLLITLERGAFLWFSAYCAGVGLAALAFLP